MNSCNGQKQSVIFKHIFDQSKECCQKIQMIGDAEFVEVLSRETRNHSEVRTSLQDYNC